MPVFITDGHNLNYIRYVDNTADDRLRKGTAKTLRQDSEGKREERSSNSKTEYMVVLKMSSSKYALQFGDIGIKKVQTLHSQWGSQCKE